MHRRNAAEFRVDLRNECAELQLFRKLARVEIAHCTRLNFARVDLRVVERLLAGFDDQMPDRFAFLLQVALKISAPAAENINWLVHTINLSNLGSLSSATESIDAGDVLANDQGVDVMRAFVGINALEIHEMSNHGIAIGDADGAQDVARFPRTLERHPNIVALSQRNLLGTGRARFHHSGKTQRQ